MRRPGWPEIKSYGRLTVEDLVRHPVWINCHTADEDEEWYGEALEDDYRPYLGELPTFPWDDLFIVRAAAILGDGTHLPGFVELFPGEDLEQAAEGSVFGRDHHVGFAPANMGLGANYRADVIANFEGREEDRLFPLEVASDIDKRLPLVRVQDWFTRTLEWPER